MTQQDVNRRQLKAAPKPSKYRNVRYETAGEKFDSKHEAEIWMMLKARESAGEITDLKRQVHFALCAPQYSTPDTINPARSTVLVAEYIADFVYYDRDGQYHVVDAKRKQTRTQTYLLKRKWLDLQSGIKIEEI